ncbi:MULTISPECIES: rod shape-determining protein RodA [unclassified Salinicola]|uniref:rod shape-determining protein RodA n=1 Tax=unclassified Salinicola TaxID=2634022 RepID=UPI001A8CBD35|nr:MULTISPECIES: rod shape-determining protein RodA [unclassified Salinicola]MCE3025419.1 rod shape-determining protein RodA [Salinicola sp. DM10]WIX34438.1 rod shape-determining protein RodA [Salinicola sp. JS01]
MAIDFQRTAPNHGARVGRKRSLWLRLHLDPWLLSILLLLIAFGLVVLYSASGMSAQTTMAQAIRMGIALVGAIVIAQFSPATLYRWTPLAYGGGLLMLIAVEIMGDIGMGAQRWLEIGPLRFQPSELMKIAMPMMLAAYLHRRPLPPSWRDLLVCGVIIAVPVLLIARQPDLGTSMLVTAAAVFVILLAGLSWRFILSLAVMAGAAMPLLWLNMHNYQRQRVLTFLNPESDPLGAGWNIIQSKTAIGSGGLEGKGWGLGTQSQLEFLPERHTDFIVAVLGEEFGLIGMATILVLYLLLVSRGLVMANQAQDTYGRLLAGSIVLTFFIYVFVNIGMVSGILPVVGVPLPLVSYGGTSSVTLMAGFGILMSIHTHRRLLKH